MLLIPLVGTALDHGHAPLALVLLAAFVAAAGALKLTAPAPPSDASSAYDVARASSRL